MNRPAWNATAAQRRALAKAVEDAAAADTMEEKAWQSILAARKLGVPDTVLCEQTNRSRATLNRKFGPRPDPEG